MTWNNFIYYALPAILMWLCAGALIYLPQREKLANVFIVMGIAIFAFFIAGFWILTDGPPL